MGRVNRFGEEDPWSAKRLARHELVAISVLRGTSGGRCVSELLALMSSICCVRPDRKSTRLNSSHVAISYAVFCLKKKKYTRLGSSDLKRVPNVIHLIDQRLTLRYSIRSVSL